MENNKTNSQSGQKKKSSSNGYLWYIKFGALVLIVLILMVLIAAMHESRNEYARSRVFAKGGILGVHYDGGGQCGNFMVWKGEGSGNPQLNLLQKPEPDEPEKTEAATSRIFGTITAIDGNKITIYDNGGTDQPVLSLAGTIITSGGKEVGLKTLAAGDNIVVQGAMNADNVFEAKMIIVQE